MTARALRTSAALLGVVLGGLAPGEGVRAQTPGDPDPVRLVIESSTGGSVLRLEVADGWYVYGTGASTVGLPLRAERVADGAPLPLRPLSAPEVVEVAGVPVPIHRGTTRFRIDPGGSRAGVAVRVSWAACRGDLCMPGARVVEVARSTAHGLIPAAYGVTFRQTPAHR